MLNFRLVVYIGKPFLGIFCIMEKITLFKVNVKIILLFNLTQEALSPTPLTPI